MELEEDLTDGKIEIPNVSGVQISDNSFFLFFTFLEETVFESSQSKIFPLVFVSLQLVHSTITLSK